MKNGTDIFTFTIPFTRKQNYKHSDHGKRTKFWKELTLLIEWIQYQSDGMV